MHYTIPHYHRTSTRLRFPLTFRAIIVALLATGLVGCTVGPAWHPPTTPKEKGYLAGKMAQGTIGANGSTGTAQVFEYGKALRRDWYRLFGNHALNRLIEAALASNPARAAAQERLAAAREVVIETQGSRFPSIGLGAGISRNRASGVIFGIQSPAFVNTFSLYQGQLSAEYDLNVFGELTRRLEKARALAAVAETQLMNTDATIVDNVIASALAEAAARTTLRSVRTILIDEHKILRVRNEQLHYGTASQSDVLRARTRLDDSLALAPALRQQITVARHRLAILIGKGPSRFVGPQFTLSDFMLPARLPVSMPAQLVRQRPDIVLAVNLVHAAQAELGIATAQLLPQVQLTAGYGRVGLHPGDLTNPAAAIFNVGAELMAPLFEGGALRARKRQAYDQYRAALADYQDVVLRAFGQVANSLRALQQDAIVLSARAQERRNAQKALKLVESRQRQGTADAINLYSARIAAQHSEISYTRARLARLVDTATLIRALGGGWWHHRSFAVKAVSSSKGPVNPS